MATQERVRETYWCPGPWPWQWFRTCVRTVTKWCYHFSHWKTTNYGLAGYNVACENGRKYTWWSWGFGAGTILHVPQRKCFDDKLEDKGPCDWEPTTAPG